jgi:TOBE-like domain
VTRVTPLGAFVRIDVELADDHRVRVELTRERFLALEPQLGQTLFVCPRDLKVFLDHTHENRKP